MGLNDYKQICQFFPRGGRGIDVHCSDVGLQDPSTVAGDAFDGISSNVLPTSIDEANNKHGSYAEWIKNVQTKRNDEWQMNVTFEDSPDTISPPDFEKFKLFHDGVESYAMAQTTTCSHHAWSVLWKANFLRCNAKSKGQKLVLTLVRSQECLHWRSLKGSQKMAR